MIQQDIWYVNPIYYLTEKTLLNQFIPDSSMTSAEQLNAVLRFSIYFSLLVFVIKRDYRVLVLPVFISILTYFLYSFEKNKDKNRDAIIEKLNISKNKNTDLYCTTPSTENPFMNVNYTDYKEFPNKPAACMAFNPNVKKDINSKFNKNYTRPIDDVFEKEGGYRQFYTTPNTTIPNDQDSFAKWLYTPKLRFKKN